MILDKSGWRFCLFCVLAACAPDKAPVVAGRANTLSDYVDGRVAGDPVDCINTQSSSGLSTVDETTLVYRSGATLFVNTLPARCPGLDPLDTLIVEQFGSRLCRGDKVRGLEPGTAIPGPICRLGSFVPYRKPKLPPEAGTNG
jgi:hypothetical protein